MINQKFFTVLGGSSRTVVRAALLTEIYPINIGGDTATVGSVSILEGRIFGALNNTENFSMSVPAIIAGTMKEVGLVQRTGTSGLSISVPAIIAGSMVELVKRVDIVEDTLVTSLPSVLSGNLQVIVINLSESSDTVSVTQASVLAGSLT